MRAANSIILDFCKAKDVHAALGIILQGICEETGWSLGQAWLPSPEQSGLVCSPGWHASLEGFDEFHIASSRLVIRDDDEIPGAVWAREEPIWIDDARTLTSLRNVAADRAGLRTAMGLPIVDRDQVIGVLEVFGQKPRKRDEKLLGTAATMAIDIGALVRCKLADEALRRREERLEKLLQTGHDAIWEWDLATHRMAWGRGIRSAFGFSVHQVTPDPAWRAQHIHPGDRERVVASLAEAIDSGAGSWSETYRFLRADGSAVAVIDHAIIVRGEQQQPTCIMGAMLALDRVLTPDALRLNEEAGQERAIGVVHNGRTAAANEHARHGAFTPTLVRAHS